MLEFDDLMNIKPSVYSFIMVGLMSVAFIVLAKFLVNKYNNPVTMLVRDFVNAV